MMGMVKTMENSAPGDRTANSDGPPPEYHIFGIKFTIIDYGGLCEELRARLQRRDTALVFTPNIDHVVRCDHLDDLRRAYAGADYSVVDGKPLLWAARFFGIPLRQKLSGSDLAPNLSGWAAEHGYSIFLFGAAPGVADDAAAELKRRHPGLRVAGTYCPPMGFEDDPEANAAAIEAVRSADADLLFVAMSAPRQELWLSQHRNELGVGAAFGIGATLDFLAGRVRRAPVWMQNAGLEWAYRIWQEPRRLWRRYLVEDTAFLWIFLREWRTRGKR